MQLPYTPREQNPRTTKIKETFRGTVTIIYAEGKDLAYDGN
jgi:hypothetical protein